MRFDGKHVVVTGASRGIGRAVAEAFAAAGARLTILADDPGDHAGRQGDRAIRFGGGVADPAATSPTAPPCRRLSPSSMRSTCSSTMPGWSA